MPEITCKIILKSLAKLKSVAVSSLHVMSWGFRFGPRRTFSLYKKLLSFDDLNFDKIYYQRENPDVSGLHPYVHYLEVGARRGAFKQPPQPRYLPCRTLSLTPWKGSLDQALSWRGEDIYTINTDPLNVEYDPASAHISIIMPYYNRADCVQRAINSILKQSWKDWTLFIIDDGSEDSGIADIKTKYKAHVASGKIVILTEPHSGASVARNAGLAATSSPWIAYLDTDNEWSAEHLEAHMKTLERTGAAWTYSDLICPDRGIIETGPYERYRLLQENFIDLNTVVHHRLLYEILGGFDARLKRLIDYDLVLRYGRLVPPVKTQRSTVSYTPQNNSISLTENFLKARERVRLNHICERIGVGLEEARFLIGKDHLELQLVLRDWNFETETFETLQDLQHLKFKDDELTNVIVLDDQFIEDLSPSDLSISSRYIFCAGRLEIAKIAISLSLACPHEIIATCIIGNFNLGSSSHQALTLQYPKPDAPN